MSLDKTTIARPYAKAIFDLALAEKKIPQWDTLLLTLASIVLVPEMQALLINPSISRKTVGEYLEKLVLKVYAQDKATHQITLEEKNLIAKLAENQRLSALPQIYDLFTVLVEEHHRAMSVEVTSYLPLTAEQQAALVQKLEQRLQLKISLQCHVDSELQGGLIVRAGGSFFDGSVSGQLEKLKKVLVA